MARGVAEQDGGRKRGGEEDVSVVLGVLGRGRGIACRLSDTKRESSAGEKAASDGGGPPAAWTLLGSGR